MKKLLIVSALLAVTASTAMAQGGINLSWNDCGSNGLSNLTFACNSNTGAPFTMIASCIAPVPLPQFLGVSARIDIRNGGSTQTPGNLADWWAHGTGLCRGATALSANFDFVSGPFTCLDWAGGTAAGGSLYQVGGIIPPQGGGLAGPDVATLLVQCAIPAGTEVAVDEVTELYAFKVNVTRAKTTGTGNCTGCNTPACIVLNNIQMFQPLEQNNDPILNSPINSNFVSWQALPSSPPCPEATPTRSSSWGQVKSLYR